MKKNLYLAVCALAAAGLFLWGTAAAALSLPAGQWWHLTGPVLTTAIVTGEVEPAVYWTTLSAP